MSFPKIRITDAGRMMLSTVLSENYGMEFTKFAVGSGDASQDETQWDTLTGLVEHQFDVGIIDCARENDVVVLSGQFSNATVQNAFEWKELGIYATLVDPNTPYVVDEQLVFYGNSQDLSEYVPNSDASVAVTHKWSTKLVISSDADISAIVRTITYATVEDLTAHTSREDNPHGVTAEQIGLGNVPNLATNDLTPTYTVPTYTMPSQLLSGETLRTAFGKIANAIKILINHLNDRGNPHGVTYVQAGASPTSHASQSTNYGKADATLYGHVRLSDDPSQTVGKNNGTAATPKALYTVKQVALEAQATADAATANANTRGYPSYAGAYIGTGTSGVNGKCSITFHDTCPKIIFVKKHGSISGNNTEYAMLFVFAGEGFSHYHPTGNVNNYQDLVVSRSGNTVSWYHATNPNNQMNISGERYDYVGIM